MTAKKIIFITILFLLLGFGAYCGLTGCFSGGGDSNGGGNETTIQPVGTGTTLPPDPGEAGKSTLEGIDSDNDGVRDDIQRYIALTYLDSEKTRAALTQVTKAIQASLLDTDDKDASNAHTVDVFQAIECLYFLRTNDADAGNILDTLRTGILNTADRREAWLKADQHFGGESYSVASEEEAPSRCDFDVGVMEN
jgi:hypothetical protein